MKKLMKMYITAVCAILALFIFMKIILPPFGVIITYKMPFTEIFILAAVSVAAVLSAILRLLGENAGLGAVMLFPLTVFFWIVMIFFGDYGELWMTPVLSAAVSAVAFAFGKARFSAKALCGVLALLISFPLFSYTVINMMFGDVAIRTVLARADSPYSHMSAELIEIDTGALGADYHIEVWENGADTDLGFAKITKERQSVPVQDYYRTEIRMEFTDEDTVVINGDKYKVG